MEPGSIRFGGYQPPASVHSRGAAALGRALAVRRGDRVRFELDGDIVATGRPAVELLRLVERGELTMCYFATSYLAHRVPELAVLDLPFALDRREWAYALLDGALGALLAERVEAATGYRVLGYWDNGFRHLTNRVRPLRTPADCRGLRIRTLASELHQAVFARLGFEPVALDVKDLLAAVRAGTIDAQDNSLTNVHMFEIHRQHRHLTLSGHFYGAAFLLCHAASYHGWPIEVRQAVEAAAREATAAQRALAAAEDGEALAKLERDGTAIVRLTEGDRAAFADAVAPVTAEWRDRLGVRLFDYLS
jgi:TRAP-type transport system periplasmic protein